LAAEIKGPDRGEQENPGKKKPHTTKRGVLSKLTHGNARVGERGEVKQRRATFTSIALTQRKKDARISSEIGGNKLPL